MRDSDLLKCPDGKKHKLKPGDTTTCPDCGREHKRGDVTIRIQKKRKKIFYRYWQTNDRCIEVGPYDK